MDFPDKSRPALPLPRLLSVGDETDEAGRLLLEDSATKHGRQRAIKRGVAMRRVPCPYRDTPSRLGRPMNASAYEALRADVAGMLDGFAWLRAHRLDEDPSCANAVRLLYDVSYLGITLPFPLFHRATDPVAPTGQLPTVVASIFKASRGLFSVAVSMLNEDWAPDRRIDAAEVVAYADRHANLIRPQPLRVCAAPTRLIERTVSVILTGTGATPSVSTLGDLVDFPMLWRFYRVQDNLSHALSTYRFVYDRLTAADSGSVQDDLFARTVPGTHGTFGQLTEAMLAQANSAQEQLNRLLGRHGTAPSIGVAELLDLL